MNGSGFLGSGIGPSAFLGGGDSRSTIPALAGGISPSNLIAYYQAIRAPSQSASYINLANPGTYNAGETGSIAPTWAAATGWTFDRAASHHLRTALVPGVGYSAIVRSKVTLVAATDLCQFTARTLPGTYASFGFNFRDNLERYRRAATVQVANDTTPTDDHVFAITPVKYYRDGVSLGSFTQAWDVTPASELWIGCQHRNGDSTVYAPWHGIIRLVAIYDLSLSDAQVAAVSAAMAAL